MPQDEAQHSPLPWAVCKEAPNPSWLVGVTIFSPVEGKRVADTCVLDERCEVNADLIVRAVNVHDDLLAALKCFLDDERFDVAVGGNPTAVDEMLEQARAAYRKATGEA